MFFPLLATAHCKRLGTIFADPPWQFQNRTTKVVILSAMI